MVSVNFKLSKFLLTTTETTSDAKSKSKLKLIETYPECEEGIWYVSSWQSFLVDLLWQWNCLFQKQMFNLPLLKSLINTHQNYYQAGWRSHAASIHSWKVVWHGEKLQSFILKWNSSIWAKIEIASLHSLRQTRQLSNWNK